jgi:glyoxylase-like metal-dependent hydrolase (beta-lactamase superfamily II)
VALAGGESIDVAPRRLDVEYTPGHASHHVSYFDESARVAFVGDTAGMSLLPGGYVLPPTPPPDIDLEAWAWASSLGLIERRRPGTLFLTHFGPHAPAGTHLAELRAHLTSIAELARASLERDDNDENRERWFVESVVDDVRRRHGDDITAAYQVAGRFDLSWRGLARYWRKRRA